MINLKTIAGIAAAFAAIAAGSADAKIVTLSPQGNNAFGSPLWAQNVTRTIGTETGRFGAGLFRLEDADENEILAFCVEAGAMLDLDTPFDTMAAAHPSASAMDQIQRLFASSYGNVTNAASAAGFQLAIWEIVEETSGTLDVTQGHHSAQATNAAIGFATDFLAAMLKQKNSNSWAFTTYVNAGQDIISGTQVPVPAAALLFAPAAAFFATRKRRKA